MGLITGKGIKGNSLSARHIFMLNDEVFKGKKVDGSQLDLFKINTNDILEFLVKPIVPNPSSNSEIANKYYVDTEINNALTGGVTGTWIAPVIRIENDSANISNPADGERYIVGTSPANDFVGHENEIATYDAGSSSWNFEAPESGMICYPDYDSNVLLTYTTLWQERGFEGTTASGLLKMVSKDVQVKEIEAGQIIIGQGLANAPLAKAITGAISLDENGTTTLQTSSVTGASLDTSVADETKGLKLNTTSHKLEAKIDDTNQTNALSESGEIISPIRKYIEYNINDTDATNESVTLGPFNGFAYLNDDFVFYAHGAIFNDNITVTTYNNDDDTNKTHTITINWSNNGDLSSGGISELVDGEQVAIQYPVLKLDR